VFAATERAYWSYAETKNKKKKKTKKKKKKTKQKKKKFKQILALQAHHSFEVLDSQK
jgi:Na+-transporting methylmalonyl-CoA/oxaloacetate decarboxylase gamma subunit